MEITEVTESSHAPPLEIEVKDTTDKGQFVVRFAYISPPNSGPELRRFYIVNSTLDDYLKGEEFRALSKMEKMATEEAKNRVEKSEFLNS